MLRPTAKYSLEPHEGPYHTWGTTSVLRVDGVSTAEHVPGFVIEGQYTGNGFSILITSYDCPFEEAQNFLLLGGEHGIVSELFLGQMFGSYLLTRNYPVGDGAIALEFAGCETPWILHVEPDWWPCAQKLWLQMPNGRRYVE